MAKAGEITIELRLVDYLSKPLDRLAWKLLTMDGCWHVQFMKADRLFQKVVSR